MTESKTMGPHMPLYLDRFLGGTMHFGADEIGAYILLIAHQWQYGHVENDQSMIERVARCEYGRLRRVLAKFEKACDGSLINPVCAKVRDDRQKWLSEQAERARRGAEARWRPERNAGRDAEGHSQGDAKRNAHTDTDTDTIYQQPSSQEREGGGTPSLNPPSLEKCIELASMIGLNPEQVQAFHAHYDSQGWKKGNGQPVTNIRSALQSWKIREGKFEQKEAITTGKVDTRRSRFK